MRHLLCLTVDTDPDGLSGQRTNRQALQWDGLERLQQLPDRLAESRRLRSVPVTWFVRADGQLESILGSSAYLLEKHSGFWNALQKAGHEIGWHPHLYRQAESSSTAVMISNPLEAEAELERLWDRLRTGFHPTAFRNGEGWHTAGTFAAVERLGFICDSTAIPGRRGAEGHPMNWEGAPNQPYFPGKDDLCRAGSERAMLEVPMNTWLLKAPYDHSPQTRYMNPAVHPHLFAKALETWEKACEGSVNDLAVWVMIFHPDEVLSAAGPDQLYSRSIPDLCHNLVSIIEALVRIENEFEWTTISRAAQHWRIFQGKALHEAAARKYGSE